MISVPKYMYLCTYLLPTYVPTYTSMHNAFKKNNVLNHKYLIPSISCTWPRIKIILESKTGI